VSARAFAAKVMTFAALAAVVTGCSADFDHAEVTNVKASPLGGNMNYARVEVPVGMIVTAHIVSYDDDHKTMDMDIQADDSNVVEVHNVVSEHDYAFFGIRAGTTEVKLKADGKVVMIVTAVVTDQPP
jgi:hypothetical protein